MIKNSNLCTTKKVKLQLVDFLIVQRNVLPLQKVAIINNCKFVIFRARVRNVLLYSQLVMKNSRKDMMIYISPQ